MNHLVWIIGLLVLAYLIKHWFSCPAKILKKRSFLLSKNTTPVLVFDLHGVLVDRNYWGIFKHILKNAYRLNLIVLVLKPSFIKDVFTLLKKSRVPEEFVVELSQKHHALLPIRQIVIAMMNEQRIIPSSFELIKKLKKQEYEIYLFSNIGEKTFKDLEKKFPDLFSYFDGILVVEQQDDWIQKPYPQAFAKFLARFGLSAQECVFIDNNYKNVITALQEGFYPILYQTPEELCHELIAIEVL